MLKERYQYNIQAVQICRRHIAHRSGSSSFMWKANWYVHFAIFLDIASMERATGTFVTQESSTVHLPLPDASGVSCRVIYSSHAGTHHVFMYIWRRRKEPKLALFTLTGCYSIGSTNICHLEGTRQGAFEKYYNQIESDMRKNEKGKNNRNGMRKDNVSKRRKVVWTVVDNKDCRFHTARVQWFHETLYALGKFFSDEPSINLEDMWTVQANLLKIKIEYFSRKWNHIGYLMF